MAPITLLNKGSLIPYMGEKKADLDELVPLNYIMDWVGTKIDSKTAESMSDRVIILLSKTGSGKSSSIAPTLY
jgi:putative ribosome biogenesis GTPase RsgA